MNMYNAKEYFAHVFGRDGIKASIFCITYTLSPNGDEAAARFHEIVCEFPDLKPPYSSPYSFKEELRLLSSANAVVQGPRANEKGFIAYKMSEAYGPLLDVKVEKIPRE